MQDYPEYKYRPRRKKHGKRGGRNANSNANANAAQQPQQQQQQQQQQRHSTAVMHDSLPRGFNQAMPSNNCVPQQQYQTSASSSPPCM